MMPKMQHQDRKLWKKFTFFRNPSLADGREMGGFPSHVLVILYPYREIFSKISDSSLFYYKYMYYIPNLHRYLTFGVHIL